MNTQDAIAALERVLNSDPALACVAPVQVTPDGQPVRVNWPFPSPTGAWLEALGMARLWPP